MPKKKSKVNKLARMSDEERARYLQHRADLEEEARRRKRELIARFIKNKLDKEEAFSRLNTAKVNHEWRFILRKIKCKQMYAEIEGLQNSFNFMMDRKQRLLDFLLKAVESSDDQNRRAFQAHTETLSYFLGIGAQRLDKLQKEFERRKFQLLEVWEKECMEISDNQDRAEMKLKLIIYIQENIFNNNKKEKALERATAKNDKKLEHDEEMRSFCQPKQLEIENYWCKLRELYSSYLEQHNPILGHYQLLKEKDEFYQKDIAKNEIQIKRASDTVLYLHRDWLKTTNTIACKLKRLNDHKDELSRKYLLMKKESKTEKKKSNEQLSVMVDASQGAIKRLEDLIEKLNKIIQMAEICQKYELEKDTLLENTSDKVENIEFEHLDESMKEECEEYRKLDKFMLKVNRVRVQTLCLKSEKAKLTKENVQLKHYIKRYLTNLALVGGIDRPATVKMISENHKYNRKTNRPVTCIEGALSNAVMHEKRMQIEKKNREMDVPKSFPRLQCWS